MSVRDNQCSIYFLYSDRKSYVNGAFEFLYTLVHRVCVERIALDQYCSCKKQEARKIILFQFMKKNDGLFIDERFKN